MISKRSHLESGAPAAQRPKRNGQDTALDKAKKAKAAQRTPGAARAASCESKIPPWQTLPYHVLLQIFDYASFPLRDPYFQPLPSIPWLLGVSRLCRAFAEPALAALYASPPVLNASRGHKLLDLLQCAGSHGFIDYSAKIRHLDIEVWHTLHYTCPGRGHLDLGALILKLPRLRDLELFCVDDSPTFKGTTYGSRHVYPDSVFLALQDRDTRLRSWRWNSRMCKPGDPVPTMESIHQTAAFQSLRSLTFVGFHPKSCSDSKTPGGTQGKRGHQLAETTHLLPYLQKLAFEMCDVVDGDFLSQLPLQLSSLSIIACTNLSSEGLHAFLVSHGSNLRELHLNHNRSLNLSFLTHLASSCPRLRVLEMDLHYHSDPIRRTDPGFDILLSVDEIPDWPSDLERLELAYLRHWNGELASMFFRSLVESAQKLARLRCLAIKTSLQIEWRDRATFRESWIRRLEYVFLRTPPPPDSRLGSIRGWKQSEDGRFSDRPSAAAPKARTGPISPAARPVTGELAASSLVSSSPMHPGRRRSSRISRIANVVKGSKTRHEYRTSRDICSGNRLRSRPSAQPPLRSSRSKRACKSQDHVVESGSDMDDTSSDTSSGDGTVNDKSAYTNTSDVPEDDDRLYRQAMCDVVDIRIDNLRPMGVQYNEDDFLDAEASGDEDWDGKNEVSSRVQYAW